MSQKLSQKFELKAADLRCVCDHRVFKFKNTSQIKPLDEVIGQERAVQALEFGLNMNHSGYNIFVTGLEGTGKSTIVQDYVTKHARTLPKPNDWCLVNNFKDEFRPHAIEVPSGKAVQLSKKINRFIQILKKDLPAAFESEMYLKRLSAIKTRYSEKQSRLFQKIETYAAKKNLQILTTDEEFETVPVVDGQPLTAEDFNNLSIDQKTEIEENIRQIKNQIEMSSVEVDKLNIALRSDVEELMDEVTQSVVQSRLEKIRSEFKDSRNIMVHIDAVEQDIIENVNFFMPAEEGGSGEENIFLLPQKSKLHRYQINPLTDHGPPKGAPVIFETNPTYHNVMGRIEKRAHMGTVTTDFTMVQAGSLLEANGGFLIMDMESVLTNPYVWEALKRALQNKSIQIEDIAEESGFGTVSLRPEAIPLKVKVILLGSYDAFEVLQNYDPRFNKTFKVRADFDHEVERNADTVQQYARFIARVCREENLLAFTPKGVATIVEYGEKYVSDRDKLSIRFGPLLGVLREADYWARKNNARYVSDKYVVKAFNKYRFRYNLYEEKIHDSYRDETIMIDVDSDVVGQVNALAVYQIGEFSFGRPVRITAEAFMGKEGVINIEREANLSGSTHDKGVLILSGYVGRTFAQSYPLNLSISITFEQSYDGIDGDSASSTELYAILSSLSDIPIKQGIAVTGSVNQKGQIQAIGGVNHKIEGFYEVCKTKGFTGKQGVMIPRANQRNLMLSKEVIDAVKKRKFHVYQVATVEDGIEILTGTPAGKADRDGNFPKGTVYGAVQQKLKQYYQRSLELKKELE
ncbi:ATP-dependent protease La (EC Type II [Olavius sp. associated proteobacterium Delta 1]|nr:ATP-dependent protease La (EC Type II [Olavius sp. associated proteobacterium Delta 1]